MQPTNSFAIVCCECGRVYGCNCKNVRLECDKNCTTQNGCETIIEFKLGKTVSYGFCKDCLDEKYNRMYPGEGKL